jgi:hypothetical protein
VIGQQSTDTVADSFASEDGPELRSLLVARDLLDQFLEGPMPTPSFDQFVAVSGLLSSAVDDDVKNAVAANTAYLRQFGNLLTLGDLHFAPDSALTRRLITHLNESNVLFSQVPVFVHASSGDAVDRVLRHTERRTWAIVALDDRGNAEDDDLSAQNVAYTLRLNYTTLPLTGYLNRWVTLGLDPIYQRYYLSGFLRYRCLSTNAVLAVCNHLRSLLLPPLLPC